MNIFKIDFDLASSLFGILIMIFEGSCHQIKDRSKLLSALTKDTKSELANLNSTLSF